MSLRPIDHLIVIKKDEKTNKEREKEEKKR